MKIKIHDLMTKMVGDFTFAKEPLYLSDINIGDTFVFPRTDNNGSEIDDPSDPTLVRSEVIIGKEILPGPNDNFKELELLTIHGNKIRISLIDVGDFKYRIDGKSVIQDKDGNRYLFPLYNAAKNISSNRLMAYWFQSAYEDAPEGFQIVCMEEDLHQDYNSEL